VENHPKHVEHIPDINKLCNFASCWIYIGILFGAHPILHISRIKVNNVEISGDGNVIKRGTENILKYLYKNLLV
jgi:hypothetical protein